MEGCLLLGVQEVPSSNLGSPTKFLKELQTSDLSEAPVWSPTGVQLESKMDSGRVHAVDPIRRRRQIHHTMCTAPLLHQRRELCSCAAAEPPHRRRGTCQRGSRITGCQWAPYFSLGYSFSFNSDNGNKSRRRNLWVTDTLQWRPRARLAQPANPMRDSAASAFCSS